MFLISGEQIFVFLLTLLNIYNEIVGHYTSVMCLIAYVHYPILLWPYALLCSALPPSGSITCKCDCMQKAAFFIALYGGSKEEYKKNQFTFNVQKTIWHFTLQNLFLCCCCHPLRHVTYKNHLNVFKFSFF